MPKIILGVTLYNRKETAEMLGVTTRSIQNYTANDLLTGQKIGGQYFYTESNIVNFINGRSSKEQFNPSLQDKKD